MPVIRHAIWLVLLSASLAPTAAWAGDDAPVRIGSKRFTESYILAEIAVEAVRRAGGSATHIQGLGGTAVVFRALEEGAVDVYPEYTGTIAEAILHETGGANGGIGSLRSSLARRGIGMSEPLGFENTYALAVSRKSPVSARIATISDLAHAPDLRFGFSPEFLGRSDGFHALAEHYGISNAHIQAIEHGLAYEAMATGALDVTDVYSTDAKIERYDLKVLADDRRFFHSYQAVLLYRDEVLRRAPQAMTAIAALAGTIDGPTMTRLNARAEIDGWTFASVAREFFRSREGSLAGVRRERPGVIPGMMSVIVAEGPRHVELVALSLLLAAAVGIPVGAAASRSRRMGRLVIGATSIAQTVPALALLCFFVPLFGTGIVPALAALFLYALLPIMRNTVAGLDAIPPSLRESATALGLTRWAQLVRVDLPLASRTILAGVRTSAVIGVGGATLAAFVGAGGFGAPISTGLNLDDTTLILEGAIPAALLALVVEGVFALLDRTLIPRGLRLAPDVKREGE